MLIDFFYTLRAAKLPVSVKELLTLLQALQLGVVGPLTPADGDDGARTSDSLDDFYFLSRATLVKDEKHYDKFDRAFAAYFQGVDAMADFSQTVPKEWLRANLARVLSDEEMAAMDTLAWPELMDTLKKRLDEQKERHEGGNKWIGTGGTSPFGHSGYDPKGIRIGGQSTHHTAVKVWEQRSYRDYDDQQALGLRNVKVALRRLRRFARSGAHDELDLPDTIRATASNAGFLDLKMVPERRNNVKVLLLLDVGGSMDAHAAQMRELFSAAKAEFKHLEFYYFHNCVYDFVWKTNHRRFADQTPTADILRKYNKDYKLIFVGDATMSPHEIFEVGGSMEYANAVAGHAWLDKLTQAFPKFAWLNPEPQGVWTHRQSVGMVRDLMGQHMFPLTLRGLEDAMRHLSK